MSPTSGRQPAVEVRGFGPLKKVFEARHWDFPYYYSIDGTCSALDLAVSMDLPLDQIEAVFVNGIASALNEAVIKAGDRVGFIPPGVPGPYRVMLGIVRLPQAQAKTDKK